MAKEYNISRPAGRCRTCDRQLEVKEEFTATVRESGEELLREDYCLPCWEKHEGKDSPQLLGVWRAHIPEPQEKKKTFIDDALLINFFERLEGASEPMKISFRYVLALVLMRKRLLVYDRAKKEGDAEVWQMHFKGSDKVHQVVDPRMDEQKIAEVSQQLGSILEGEL